MPEFELSKQRDAARTKARILAAAQEEFSRQGYAQAGIRDIGARAGVSSTLLLRYYGSKAGLFEAALIDAVNAEEVFAARREEFGAHLARLLSNPAADIKPPLMIALASGDPEASAIAGRVAEEYSVKPLAKWLGPPDARARAAQIITLSIGYAFCTRQLPLGAASRGADRKLTQWLAESIQAIVDQC